MKPAFRRIFRFFSSLRLTVFLLGAGLLTAAAAGLIPQNLPPGSYREILPPWLARAVPVLGLDGVFRSPLFLALLLLFWLNLLACTLRRLLRARNHRGRRFGPDLIHGGLLILIAGGLVTSLFRAEALVYLSPGDAVRLSASEFLVLEDFRFDTYPDGRPEAWISRVRRERVPSAEESGVKPDEGESGAPGTAREIRVNRPLRYRGLTIYQSDYRPGEKEDSWESGLTVTRDPGRPVILAGFILLGPGLVLTLYQKRRDL